MIYLSRADTISLGVSLFMYTPKPGQAGSNDKTTTQCSGTFAEPRLCLRYEIFILVVVRSTAHLSSSIVVCSFV